MTTTTTKKLSHRLSPNFARSRPAIENRTPGTKVWCLANNRYEK